MVYWVILLVLLGLFFTNDFGLVDIRKTSIITAIGIDYVDGEVEVTAQLAVPQPSQSGEAVQYAAVQGTGLTVADALNEINSKTGFYPKLLFCKLIILGESCQKGDIFEILDSFYRNNYSELTALVAMYKGKINELLSEPTPITDLNALSVQRVLSEELKKSANVSTVNLKDIAVSRYSESGTCYMPLVEAHKPLTSESGGDGDSVGGESPEQGSGGSGGSGGESGGSGGGSSGGSSGSEGGGGGGSSSLQKADYTARKTAIFKNGKFAGILDDKQSFALDILKNDVQLAVVPCKADGLSYTLGLKNASGKVKLSVKEGVPEFKLSFKAKAHIRSVTKAGEPEETARDDNVPEGVLKACQGEIEERLQSLIDAIKTSGCDVLGAKEQLYKYNFKYYEAFKDTLLERMKVVYDIKIESVN